MSFWNCPHHAFEHVEGFFLVGNERVLLGVAAETNAFFEVIHAQEMVFPQAVEDAEHDDPLVRRMA